MSNTVILKGFFGNKQSFWVTPATILTGWQAGQLFKISSATGQAYVASPQYLGAEASRGPFVALNSTSGACIAGVALESSADAALAVSGMQNASGSMVTLLWGPSSFFIRSNDTTAINRRYYACYEANVPSATLMDPLYASSNGRFSTFVGGALKAGIFDSIQPNPIGYVSQVPAVTNSWTLGVVLF